MKLKVLGGTAPSGENLCRTCRHAHITKGQRESSERILCTKVDKPVSFPIAECSGYDDRRQPSRWDMEEVAWVLRTNKAGKVVGFTAPKTSEAQSPGFARVKE